jgi:transcriptional regulator with XRE-family HTH domain
MIAYGQWEPFTDAAPAREHVRSLQAQGLGWQRIAELAGVAPPMVSSMLYGRSGRAPTGKIRTATAEALLAFRPALDDLPGTSPVDAAGTRRRLRALAVAGWSAQCLAGYLGTDRAQAARIVRGAVPRVTAATARAVRALHDELWNRPPPEGTRWEKAAASRTRNHARRQGWPPALAYDEDAIDDPAAEPVPGWERCGERRGPGMLAAEAAELAGFGLGQREAAERLGVSVSTLTTTMARVRAREAGDVAA